MSVDVTNETQWVIDPKVFSDLGIWVLDQMRVSTQSDPVSYTHLTLPTSS